MKKILISIFVVAGVLLFGTAVFAAPTSWDYASGILQPLQSQWAAQVKVPNLIATSTATSSFAGPLVVNGTSTLATTTTSYINNIINVTGFPYPQTSAGVTAALNTCSFLYNIGLCGHVHLASGTYSITSNVTFPSFILVDGDGYSTDLVLSDAVQLQTSNNSVIHLSNFRVDATSHGPYTGGGSERAITINNPVDVELDHIWSFGGYGFNTFVSTSNPSNATSTYGQVQLSYDEFTGMGSQDVVGGGPSDASSTLSMVQIDHDFIYQNNTSTTTDSNAIDIVAQNQTLIDDNTTEGNIVLGGEKIPHYHATVSNNIITPAIGVGYSAIKVLTASNAGQNASSSYVTLSNNQITQGHILVQGQSTTNSKTQYVNIEDNNIEGTTNLSPGNDPEYTYDIHLEYTNGVNVSGNTLIGGNSCVRYNNSSNLTLGINYMSGCTTMFDDQGGNSAVTQLVSANGNFGIGTTSPFKTLSVAGGVSVTNNTNNYIGSLQASPGDATLYVYRSVGEGTPPTTSGTIAQFGSNQGSSFSGSISVIAGSLSSAAIGFGNYLADEAGKISWSNASSAFNFTGGNVGIATSSPARLFTVGFNNANTGTSQMDIDQAGTGDAWMNFSVKQGGGGSYGIGMQQSTGNFTVGYNASGLTSLANNTSLSITPSGNLGIGTTSPFKTLSVAGGVSVTNNTNNYIGLLQASPGDATLYVYRSVGEGTPPTTIGTVAQFGSNSTSVFGASISVISGSQGTAAIGFGNVNADEAGRLSWANANSDFNLSGGNVGIGSTTAGSLLSVGSTNGINFSTATSTFSSTGGINLAAGCYALGGNCLSLSSFAGTLGVANGGTATTTFRSAGVIFSNGSYLTQASLTGSNDFEWDNTNNRLGIATSTPYATLSVVTGAGNVNTATSSGAIFCRTTNQCDFLGGDSTGNYMESFGAKDLYIGTANTSQAIRFVQNYGTTQPFTIDTTGKVGVGTSSPWRTFSVVGTVAFPNITTSAGLQTAVLCQSSTGEVIADSAACLASAARFKQNINPLSSSTAMQELMAIQPVTYQYKPSFNGSLESNPNYNGTFEGFIADQVGKIDPTLIEVETSTTTGAINSYPGQPAGLKIDNIVAVLWSATQSIASHQSEQDKEISQLQQEVAQLKTSGTLTMCEISQ